MKASILLDTLLAQPDLDKKKIQLVYDSLPANAKVNDFRSALINADVMTFTEVMNIFVKHTLLPRSETLLNKLEMDRQNVVHHKPEGHKQKFHISENDQLVESVAFASGDLPVQIPKPNANQFSFQHSDEKQAVMLAIELATMGELHESEIILLETLDSFDQSLSAIQVLIWVYLCTGHNDQSENWAKEMMAAGHSSQQVLELLCLAEQLQNKHLLACAHYQKLIQQKRVKSIWYLLLAYSQEKSNCPKEATDNYRIYSRIGSDESLKSFAQQHIQELTHR